VFQPRLDYHADGLGSVGAMTQASTTGTDTVQSTIFYDPWGVVYSSAGTRASIDPSWQGREKDETGIYYFRARYYDAGGNGLIGNEPVIGRFISRDPIGYSGGLNYYAFANNNPVSLGDPTGKFASSGSSLSSAIASMSYAGNSTDLGQLNSAIQNLNVANNGYQGSSWTYNAYANSSYSGGNGSYSGSSSLNSIQTALNVAGFVPGLGAPADIANAGISALRGDYTGAGLSMAGVFVGGIATGANIVNKVNNGISSASSISNNAVSSTSQVTQGIYQFTAANSGLTYVGQSGNIPARIAQHIASGKLLQSDVSTLQVTEVLGGKTAREIAEQTRINDLGGIDVLANKRNPIGPARQYLMQNQ